MALVMPTCARSETSSRVKPQRRDAVKKHGNVRSNVGCKVSAAATVNATAAADVRPMEESVVVGMRSIAAKTMTSVPPDRSTVCPEVSSETCTAVASAPSSIPPSTSTCCRRTSSLNRVSKKSE